MLPAIHIVWLPWGDDYQPRHKLTPRISERREFWRSGDEKHSQRNRFSSKYGIGSGDSLASKRVGTAILGQW